MRDDKPGFPPLIKRALFFYWHLTRSMTLGVRAAVLKENSVYLVRQSYVAGWHFPGGGVDAGESFREAVERELREEADIALDGEPEFFGIYRNAQTSKRDHVALFVIRAFVEHTPGFRSREIAEGRFFPLDALPEGTTRGTRERLAEISQARSPAIDW